MPRMAPAKATFVSKLPDSVTFEVFESLPKFISLKRKIALGEPFVSKIEAESKKTPVPGRPIITANPQPPAPVPINPAPINAAAESQVATTEVMTLLENPAENAAISGSIITDNLGLIAGLGIKQGQPHLIRQAMTQIGGSGLAAEFDLAANRIQMIRGSSGRFASPQAADLGAAVLMAAKLELQSAGGTLKAAVRGEEAKRVLNKLTAVKATNHNTKVQMGSDGILKPAGKFSTSPAGQQQRQMQASPSMSLTSSSLGVKRSEGEEEEDAGMTFVAPVEDDDSAAVFYGGQQGRSSSSTTVFYSPPKTQVTLSGTMYIGSWWDDLWDALEDAWNEITDWFNDTFDEIGDWFQDKFGDLWDNVGAFLEQVGNWFGDAADWFEDFGEWFGNLAESAREKFVSFCAAIVEAAEECWDTIQEWIDKLETAIDFIVECVSDIKACIIQGINALLQWLLQQLLKLIDKFLKNALRAIVWIFGELGKAIGGKISEFDKMVRHWIKGEFKNPLEEIALWVWDATWGAFIGSIVCLCEKACIQPLAGNLMDADNVWVSLVGTILWYVHPILEGDPLYKNTSKFGYEDLRPYSFCRWIYQGGVGMIPGVELEGVAQDIVDFAVENFGGKYSYSEAQAGPRYRKYMVDRVARDYLKQMGANQGIDGSDLTKGPSTLFAQQDRNARWYMYHTDAAQHVVDDPTASLNPTPAWIGLKARELAENVLGNFCERPESWMDWLEDQYGKNQEIPGKGPSPGCSLPTGEAQSGQCWVPYDWFTMLNSAALRDNLDEKCFNLNAPKKYVKLLVAAMWNWGNLTEDQQDAFRRGGTYGDAGPDLFAGFVFDVPCDHNFEKWSIPPWGGTPSPFYMGWPTWQGKSGHGFIKHFPENANKTQYFSYVMDWMEANSKPVPPEEVDPAEAAALATIAPLYNQGKFDGGQKSRPIRPIKPRADEGFKLSSGRRLWQSIQVRQGNPGGATVFNAPSRGSGTFSIGEMHPTPKGPIPSTRYRPEAYPPPTSMQMLAPVAASYPAESKPKGTFIGIPGNDKMATLSLPVGYDSAHERYQEIWKSLTLEERRLWAQDYPFSNGNTDYANNPYVYNPEGPPEPPDIQQFPGQNLFEEATMSLGDLAGSWHGGAASAGHGAASPASSTGNQHTQFGLAQMDNTVPQIDSYAILIPAATRTDNAAELKQLMLNPDYDWGSFPMTRKRFWAGEMLAYFEGTPWGTLDDPELTQIMLANVSNGDGTTPATPLLTFIPNGDPGDGVTDNEVGGSQAIAPSTVGPTEYATPDVDYGQSAPATPHPVTPAIPLPYTPEQVPDEIVPESEEKGKLWPWLLGGAGVLGLGAFLIFATDDEDSSESPSNEVRKTKEEA